MTITSKCIQHIGEEIIVTSYDKSVAEDRSNIIENQKSYPKKRRYAVYQMDGL